MRPPILSTTLAVTLALAPATLPAQSPVTHEPVPPLEVGAPAPDFSLPGATRFGPLAKPVHLSDFKGKTVVLAFFYKARTKG
jgi:peroxiredoxin Q/BCP